MLTNETKECQHHTSIIARNAGTHHKLFLFLPIYLPQRKHDLQVRLKISRRDGGGGGGSVVCAFSENKFVESQKFAATIYSNHE